MIIHDLFLFNLPLAAIGLPGTRYNNSGRFGEFIVYVAFNHVYFLRQKFSFQTDMVRKTVARKWSRFVAPISVACGMSIIRPAMVTMDQRSE